MQITIENSVEKTGVKFEDIKLNECKTVSDFVATLVAKTNNTKITASTIHYHLKNTDNLDWIEHCGTTFILFNDKAKNFVPGNFYEGRKRSSVTSFTK